MPSSISSQKTPKYKKLSRKRKTAKNLSILSCFMMECRWWDSNPHGFPNDFESFASAIPPHRLIFNFGTLVPVSEDWRDVQRDARNPASASLQNSTNAREFLSPTRKITKRILSPPRLPFRHTGVFYFTGNIVIIADFSPKIKMQLTTHQISANSLSPFGPRACILRETTSYPKECSL